jgi:outer membrane protein OmpU
MNKLMLGSALAVLALASAPAFAQDNASGVKLNVGGHFKGYVNYTDQDETNVVANETRKVDILRDTEVHFGGETTLDNGLTVGAQIEAKAQSGSDTSFAVDESYAYFSGTWGRVNFGEEDGAAYLLQVAAPSADDNIDGVRQFINPISESGFLGVGTKLDYANDFARGADKITYLTPVFSGFQAGASYTPKVDAYNSTDSRRLDGNTTDNTTFGDVWEAAGRYEGQFNNVGVIAGAGYTHASQDGTNGSNFTFNTGTGVINDDYNAWNVGLDLDIGAFGLGAIYTENNNGNSTLDKNDTWVVGADYTTGPFKLGVSYLDNQRDLTTTNELDSKRYTGGVTYTYGPGMSFRGSVSYLDQSQDIANTATNGDAEATSVLLGTQINF